MKKIGIFLENRFIDKEIIYYQHRFPEAGIQADFLTRLWGEPNLTFKGLDLGMEVTVDKSFETITDVEKYAAYIMPAGYVADMLRYTETPDKIAPAAEFFRRVMANRNIIKGVICHSAWIFDPIPDALKGRKLTCANNVLGSVKNAGGIFVDEDYYQDGDLYSARTGRHFAGFAERIIQGLSR